MMTAEIVDCQVDMPEVASEFFRNAIDSTPLLTTRRGRRQAYTSFSRYCGLPTIGFGDFTTERLLYWAFCFITDGHTPGTVSYYIKVLSGLYSEAVDRGLAPENDSFAIARFRLEEITPGFKPWDPAEFERLRRFVRHGAAALMAGASTLAEDLALTAILGGGIAPSVLAGLRKDSPLPGSDVIERIVSKYSRSSARARYLFPLNQSGRTPRQTEAYVSALIAAALAPFGLKTKTPDDFRRLWVQAALRCGMDAADVVACLGTDDASDVNPFFALITPAELDSAGRSEVIRLVGETLADNPLQWFAMQFRPRVTFDEIMKRLEKEPTVSDVYYPCEAFARKMKRKLVYENKPVIPGLLFFRSRLTDITPLFRRIGDMAWCYRRTNSPFSPYAVVPAAEMHAFQTAIGIFPPESDICPLGSIELRSGDKVEIIGGEFRGRSATIGEVTSPTVCRLILPGNNGIEWRVSADRRLLRLKDAEV